MARPKNHHVAGGTYYVILRGNGGRPIFLDDTDRYSLQNIISRAVSRHGIRVHAYAFRSNEAHLVVQIDQLPLSTIIQGIASQHARTVNRRHHRSGYLFQHPHRAVRIDPQLHLPTIIVHIHRLADTNWSSHQAYIGDVTRPWLTTSALWKILTKQDTDAKRIYQELMQHQPRHTPSTRRLHRTPAKALSPRPAARHVGHTYRRRHTAAATRPLRPSPHHTQICTHPRARTYCLVRIP